MLKFLFFVGLNGFILRDHNPLANYMIGKKLGFDASSRAMMAMIMREKTSNPFSFLPFLYKANDDNISLEALYLFNYIYQHGKFLVLRRFSYINYII